MLAYIADVPVVAEWYPQNPLVVGFTVQLPPPAPFTLVKHDSIPLGSSTTYMWV